MNHQYVYVTYSEGFRRGGDNAFPVSGATREPEQDIIYQPDKAKNCEVGLKGMLKSGFRYSADIFYIDWLNPQIGTQTPLNGWFVVVNGSEAKSQGFETELHAPLFIRNLELSLGYAYVDATVSKKFCVPAAVGTGDPATDVACGIEGVPGTQLPGSPVDTTYIGNIVNQYLITQARTISLRVTYMFGQ
jgi:iron complex outermembrane recepter protein